MQFEGLVDTSHHTLVNKKSLRMKYLGAGDGRKLDQGTFEQVCLRGINQFEAGERCFNVTRTFGFDPALFSPNVTASSSFTFLIKDIVFAPIRCI